MFRTLYRAFFTGRWYFDILLAAAVLVAPFLIPSGIGFLVLTAFVFNGSLNYVKMADKHILAATRPEGESGLDTHASPGVG